MHGNTGFTFFLPNVLKHHAVNWILFIVQHHHFGNGRNMNNYIHWPTVSALRKNVKTGLDVHVFKLSSQNFSFTNGHFLESFKKR